MVAPLNWGLGHATRCIPLISSLEALGAEVVLASDGVAYHLLRAEFPHLPIHVLPSYRITYDSPNMIRNIARQLPRILLAMRQEHEATEKLVETERIAGIISDNRYGCFSLKANSVILTHQLNLRIPNRSLQWLANSILRGRLANFDTVWVPDAAGEPNLSGELSHSSQAHENIRFTGILSRMEAYPAEREYDVAVVLSGPEPQRTVLENKLLEQAVSLPQDFIFIQGKTTTKQHYRVCENVEVVSFLTSRELNDVLMASRIIVCRSGYSSLMDLAVLGKKAILIPTPGQTEQEYLARFFGEKNIFLAQNQDHLDLEQAILTLGNTRGIPTGTFRTDDFKPLLERWLSEV